MFDVLRQFFDSTALSPHGVCLLWEPSLIWAHAVSDLLIAAAYFSIPATILWLALKRRDFAYHWVLYLFALFIVACGTTHVFGIVTLWEPAYGIEALVKVATATCSVATAIVLWPWLPKALALPSPARWESANRELQAALARREAAEGEVRALNAELEGKVRERTAELERVNAELTDREARLRDAHRRAGLTSWTADPRTGRMAWFDEAWRVLGVAPDAVPATTAAFRGLLHPDDAARMIALYDRVYVEPQAYAEEYRIQPSPGVVRWVRELAEARLGAGGTMQLLVGTLQDVTEQVEAERRVRESEERLLRAQRAARVGAWEWDIVADRSYSTPDELRLYGIEPDAKTPPPTGFEDFMRLVHPDDRERIRAANLEAIATKTPLEAEFRVMLPGGGQRWLLTKGDIIVDGSGRAVRMVGVNMDITQRKEAEAALAASEERFRTMVSTIDDVFWIESRNPDRLIYVSPAFERLTGRKPEELYADIDVWLECIHPDDRPLARESFQRVAEEGSFTTEYRVIRTDGEERWVRDRGYVVPTPSGVVERTTGVATDITERKQAERQRDLLMRELVHRVKNTLAVVQSIARQTRLNTDTLEAFYEKFEARLVALSLVHDLLFREGWQGASLADVIAQTLAPYGEHEDGTRRFDTEGPPVRLDPNVAVKLSMVFHELATNATKYGALSAPEGRVAVTWHRTQSDGGRDALAIRWVERGGPPVTEPVRRGFGTLLVERVAGRELGNDVTLAFAPAGLEVGITLFL